MGHYPAVRRPRTRRGGNPDVKPKDLHEREREFHDRLAADLDPERMPPKQLGVHERYLLDAVGDVDGLRVLELGCGDGGLAMHLVDRGATVTGADISPGMVEVAEGRRRRFRPEAPARFIVAPIERLPLDDEGFDCVVGKWILHHADIQAAGEEIHRLLRPGGRGIFLENQARNPLLRFAREHVAGRFGVPRLGTPDEHLLAQKDFDQWATRFDRVDLSYPDFHFFDLLNRQLLRYRCEFVTRRTRRLDRFLWTRLPGMRVYSFHVIVEMRRRLR